MSQRLKADLALVVMCVFWGSTFVLVKEALGDVSTLLFLTLRFGLAALALLVIGARPWGRKAAGKDARPTVMAGAIVGLFLFLGYFLQTQGLRWTTASKSAFITGLAVVLVPLVHGLIRRTFPGWIVIGGVGTALAGLALLTNVGGSTSINRGDIWTIACALAFTVHIILVGHYSTRSRPRDMAAGQMLTAAALGAASFGWAESAYLHPSPRLWAAVLVTGLICSALAFSVQAWAQQFTTPTHAALIYSSEPVFAWITSAIVLGESLGSRAAVGALLILAGIFMAEVFGTTATPESPAIPS